MLTAGELTTLEHSFKSITIEDFRLIFIIREDQRAAGLQTFIESKIDVKVEFCVIDKETRGSVETLLASESMINQHDSLSIFTMDVAFSPVYNSTTFPSEVDGGVLVFKSNSTSYSYAKINNNMVIETAEKIPISENAIVGVYYFKEANTFFKYAKIMIGNGDASLGEFYIAPLYNYLIRDGLGIGSKAVDVFHVFGTPEEYEFFRDHTVRNSSVKKIGLVSDHSGLDTKVLMKKSLVDMGYSVIDYGTYSHGDCDYNDVVEIAVRGYQRFEVDVIFASCKSGQGVTLAAATYPEILPTILYSENAAIYAVKHNCSNFFSVPSNVFDNPVSIEKILRLVLNESFEGGRHQLRLMKVLARKNKVTNAS
jgi:RpiB/LacA/LacB family sugar-phosphate isomerase